MNKTKLLKLITLNILLKGTIVAIPYLTQMMIDALYLEDALKEINKWGIILLSVYIVYTFLQSLYTYEIEKDERELIIDFQDKIERALYKTDYEKIKERTVGYYYQRFMQDAESAAYLYYRRKVLIYSNVIFFVMLVGVMVYYSLSLTILLLILTGLFIVITKVIIPKITYLEKETLQKNEDIGAFFENNIVGQETIKNHQAFSYFEGRFKKMFENLLDVYKKNILMEVIYDFVLIGSVMNVANIIIYWLGGFSIISGTLTFGTLTAFAIYFSRLCDIANVFMEIPKTTAKAKVAYSRMSEVLFVKEESRQKIDDIPYRSLTIKDLSFAYGSQELFRNVNLVVNTKEIIGIKGKNGSGKSTLARIIVKSITNYEGDIFYNDINLKDLSEIFIKSKILLIPSVPYVFDGTVKENVLFSNDAKLPSMCKELLDKVGLKEDRYLKENGNDLSSGQKQMIELSRAFSSRYDLYIFDEPLNYVDKDNKIFVINAIQKLQKQSSVIVISHDERVFSICDRYYTL